MAEANATNELPPEVLSKIFEHCRPNLNELVNIVDVCQLARKAAIRKYNRLGNDLVIHNRSDIFDLSFTFRSGVEDEDKDGYYRYSRVLAALLTLILQTSTGTLTHLRLINARWYANSCKMVEVIRACQHLSHLVLNGCELDEYGRRFVDIIPTLTHLELLNLRGTYLSDPPLDLSFIAAVKRGCPNISNNIMIERLAVKPSDDLSMVQFVSHVGRLDIGGLDTEQLRSLISSLNERVSQLSVGELSVTWSRGHLTDDILLSLVQRLRGLKKVDAYNCRQLTNEGVVNVIMSLPELEKIDIWGIQNIDTGIIPLLDRVVTKKNVVIEARDTKLRDEMRNNPDVQLYTGENGNICLKYRSLFK